MILNFPGGVKPTERTKLGKLNIEKISACSAVCLDAERNARAYIQNGIEVLRGTLIGENDGTPVYSSIAGVFRGIMELEGRNYFVVMSNGTNGEVEERLPEQRAITELTNEDVAESARLFSVFDSRSALPLWKLISGANGKCKRIVVDCTESDPKSAINYRLCIEHARELVGGAKLLIQATGALKCVFAAEYYRKAALSSILEYANDEKLFAIAELEEKYPYGDRAIMEALYLKTLKTGETPIDHGVLIVSPEAAISLYTAMRDGFPMLDRYVSVCGSGVKMPKNLRVPRGMTLHDITEHCRGLESGCRLIENSLLCGKRATGAIGDGVLALIGAKNQSSSPTECTGCGLCADACPIRLMPTDILAQDGLTLINNCISCGACEYICPSNIPLLRLIDRARNKTEE